MATSSGATILPAGVAWRLSLVAQIYIPAAYAVTGLCVALLVSPTVTAGIVGLMVGALLGAAVYNNSLKRALLEANRAARPLGNNPL